MVNRIARSRFPHLPSLFLDFNPHIPSLLLAFFCNMMLSFPILVLQHCARRCSLVSMLSKAHRWTRKGGLRPSRMRRSNLSVHLILRRPDPHMTFCPPYLYYSFNGPYDNYPITAGRQQMRFLPLISTLPPQNHHIIYIK